MEKLLLAITGLGEKFEALKKQLADAKAAANTDSTQEIEALKAQLAEKDKTIAARDATIADLTAKLETAQSEVNAKGTENKTLADKVTAAEKKADEALAAMGVDPKAIPAGQPGQPGSSSSQGKALWAQYNAITDPLQKTAFWRKHSAALKAARS